ncbi:MAG: GPW/gp25 family protein [Dehalococcoidales bacterium]|nr:GPW/gp25 family protein [Dehalococcoidales bacterium]
MAKDNSFIGTGWSFPPEFGNSGINVVMTPGPDNIIQMIQLILSTQLGERLMYPNFGCDLNRFMFGEMDESLLSSIRQAVTDALKLNEPRINVNEVSATISDDEPGAVIVNIDYTIRITNSRYNMVYPFYINEATMPDLTGIR